MKIDEFIRQEVEHQGFDLATTEGRLRVRWMTDAWDYAQLWHDRSLTIGDVLELGCRIEPGKNSRNVFRQCNVEVAGRHCPPWEEVPELMRSLWRRGRVLSPIVWYREFELIHPFLDGNGRVGKVIYCWQGDTLSDPEFPPNLFGTGVS